MHPQKIQDLEGDQRSVYVLEADIGFVIYFYVVFNVGMGLLIDTTYFCVFCVKRGLYTAKGDFCSVCLIIISEELLTISHLFAMGCTPHPLPFFPFIMHG